MIILQINALLRVTIREFNRTTTGQLHRTTISLTSVLFTLLIRIFSTLLTSVVFITALLNSPPIPLTLHQSCYQIPHSHSSTAPNCTKSIHKPRLLHSSVTFSSSKTSFLPSASFLFPFHLSAFLLSFLLLLCLLFTQMSMITKISNGASSLQIDKLE